ncbi:MAG: DMT family transporter [Betaproteobacteria bacterium]|nr:DMT family transporter [Betaproteobacteria bacterium]
MLPYDGPMIFDWILLGGIALTWGSIFILVKKALLYYAAWDATGLRYILCLVVLSPFIPRTLRAINRRTAWPMAVAAFTGSGLPVLLLAIAQQRINSATAALTSALTPLFTFLLGWLFFSMRLTPLQIAGIGVGLAGVAVLSFARNGLELSSDPVYGLLALASAVSYGWTANFIRRRLASIPATAGITSVFLITAPIAAMLLIAWPGEAAKVAAVPLFPGGAWLLAMVACSVTSAVWYYWLIQRRGAMFAVTAAYLIPGVAFAWGILDGEPLGAMHAASLVFIVVGVIMANAGSHSGMPPAPLIAASPPDNAPASRSYPCSTAKE